MLVGLGVLLHTLGEGQRALALLATGAALRRADGDTLGAAYAESLRGGALVSLGQYDEARREAAELQDIFGHDNVFLELMDHDLAIEQRVRDDLLRLGKELGIRPIATNDSHYTHPDDARAHVITIDIKNWNFGVSEVLENRRRHFFVLAKALEDGFLVIVLTTTL